MNEIVSFTKEVEFKTMLKEVTSISLEHTLIGEENKICGDLILSGTYKQTEASQIENPFSYKIPVEIEIDKKYSLEDLIIDIDNFTYEIKDGNKLKIDVDILLDKLKIKEEKEDELINLDDLFKDEQEKVKLELDDRDEQEEVKEESEESKSLFEKIDTKETYKTYSIYIMKENDNLDDILNKYKVTKEQLEEYNNLNEIKIGTKIIIPSIND